MLRPLILISFLSRALSSSQCPTNVSQGSVCMYGLTVGPNIGTEAPLRDFVSKISEIDFAGHELSLKRFGQRSIPSETLSCDGATFVEDEIVSATDYVSVPLITKTYLDICTDTNKIVLSATSAENCWSQCQLNAESAHNSSNFSVHWPSTLYKNGECQCIGTLVDVFNKNVDTSSQTCTPLNQCNACQVGCSSDEHCAGSLKCGSGGDAWDENDGPWGCGQALEDSGLNFCYYDMQMCSNTYREYDTDGMTLMTADSIAFEDRSIERDPIINLFDHNSGSLIKYTDVYCKDGITWGFSGSLNADKQYVTYDSNNCGGYCTRVKNDDINSCKSHCLTQKKLGFLMEFETTRTRCKCTDKYVAPSFEFTSYQCQNVATLIGDTSRTMAQLNYEYYEFGEDYHLRIPKFTGISSDATFKQIGVYNDASVEHKQAEGCSTYPCDSYEASTAEWCDMKGSYSSTQQTQSISDSVTNTCIQDCKANNAVSVVVEFKNIFHGFLPNAPFKQIGKFNQVTDSIETLEASNCLTYPCSNYVSISGTPTWCNNYTDAAFNSPTQTAADTNTCLETCKSQNARSVVIDYSVIDNGISNVKFKRFGNIETSYSKPYFSSRTKEFYKYYQQPYKDEDSPSYPCCTDILQDLTYDNYPNFYTKSNGAKIEQYCDVLPFSTTWTNTGSPSQGKSLSDADSTLFKQSGTNYHLYTWEASKSLLSDSRWRCVNICVRNHDSKSVIFNVGVLGPNWQGKYYYWHDCVCQDVDFNNCPSDNKKSDYKLTQVEGITTKYGEYIEIDDDLSDIESLHCYCQTDTIETCPENKISNSLTGKREYFEFLESGYNQTFETNCNCQDSYVDACPSHQLKTAFEDNKIYVEFDESSYEWNYYTETYPNLFVDKVPTFPTKREIEPTLEQGYEVCEYNESVPNWRLVKENHVCGDDGESLGSAGLTVQSCADKCIADPDCEFFIYGKYVNIAYDWRGLCRKQSASRASCPEGFIESEKDSGGNFKYDFYELYPAGETVSLHKSSDETCEQVCNADTRQLYWSSYKEIPSTFNAGIWSGGTCICSIHNSSVCTREFTPLSTDQYYNPNAMQYDAQTFESAGTPSCEDERYLFGARIDWRQTLKTDGWLWSMDVSGAGIRFQDVQKTRRCPRDMQPGSSKAVDGVICVQGDVTPFENTTERTISMDQTANDFCASGDRVRVFDGRGDNPGISAAERFDYCAEVCSKRLQPVDGTWTSNAVAFVHYEGLAGDALNGRCWCELSSGCADEVEIDGLSDLHFVYFGTGDTSLTTSSGSGLSVYYFLGPDVPDSTFAAGPPSVAMNGIRSSWAFPVRYELHGEYRRYNSSSYNFTGMIADKIKVCPLNLPLGYICTAVDTGSSNIDQNNGVVLWGKDTVVDATPHFHKVLFSYLPGFSIDWFRNTSYRFSQCEFGYVLGESLVGLAPLFMTPLGNISGVDFSKWANMDEVPVMRYAFGQVAACPSEDFVVYPDITILKTPEGTSTYRLGKITKNQAIEHQYNFNISFRRTTLDDEPVKVFNKIEGCMDYISFEYTTISTCANAEKSEVRSDLNVTDCLNHCFDSVSAVYNEQTRECYCENLRYPSDECEPKRWNGDLQLVSGSEICGASSRSLEMGYVWTPLECWELCQEDADHWPAILLSNEIQSRGSSNPNHKCKCVGKRISDGCETKTKQWWETQYDASSVLVRKINLKKYNVNYCKEAWPGFELKNDNFNTPSLLREYDVQICPSCAEKTLKVELNCNRWPCLACPIINQGPKCLLPGWPYRIDIDFEPVEEYTYKCVNNRFIGPQMNVENITLPDIKLDHLTVDTLHTGTGLKTCPSLNNIPSNHVCYNGHFHILDDLLNVEKFEAYWYSRRHQITSNASCCSGLNMSGMYLKDVPFQGNRDFRDVDFTNVHGDAFSLINAQFSSGYKVIRLQSTDPEGRYALVGPGVSLRNRLLKATNLSGTNLTSAILDGTTISWLTEYGDCPYGLLSEWKCIKLFNEYVQRYEYKIVGPTSNLEFENLQDFNFSGVSLEFASLRNVYGRLAACPSKLPIGWGCNEHDRYLLGPGADLTGAEITNLTTVPPWSGTLARCPDSITSYKCISGLIIGYSSGETIDLSNSDISGIDFSLLDFTRDNVELRGVYGIVKACPRSLPPNYDCVNHRIIGPYVNISSTNLTGFDLSQVTLIGANLKKAYGQVSQCPKRGMGYTCSDGYIIGMQYEIPHGADWSHKDLSNVDFSQEIHLGRKNVNFTGAYGRVQNCFAQNKNLESDWVCTQHRIIGPGVNVSGLNLKDESALYSLIDFRGIHGILKHCPVYSEFEPPIQGYGCVKNVFICPGADISNLDSHFSGEQLNGLDLTGINAGGTNFSNTLIMGTYGRLAVCPSQLNGISCVANYIVGLNNKAWGERKPPEQIDLQKSVIAGLTLWDNINLDYSRWSRVIVKEKIHAQYISGTINVAPPNNIDCSYFSDNVQCFKGMKQDGKKLKKDTMVIFSSNETIRRGEYANGYLRGEFKNVQCDTNATIKNTYLDDIDLEGSNFENCNLVNMSGTFVGSDTIWPENCDEITSGGKNIILCGNSVKLRANLSSLTANDVEKLNAHKAIIEGNIQDINIESVNMSNIVIKSPSIQGIYGKVGKCPTITTDGWLCVDDMTLLGSGQDLRDQDYSSYDYTAYIDIGDCLVNENTQLPPRAIVSPSSNLRVIQEGGDILNPSAKYQFQYNKIIGSSVTVNGTFNIDDLDSKDPYFTQGMDLVGATFETSQGFFKLHGLVTALPSGYVTVWAIDNYVVGPGLKMPDFWRDKLGACRSENTSLTEFECRDGGFQWTTFKDVVLGLRGPLMECFVPPESNFECVDNWIVGPNIDWKGFDSSITIKDEWLVHPISNLHFCPDGKNCLTQPDGSFVVFSRTGHIENKEYDLFLSDTLEFQNISMTDVSFSNGKIHFENLKSVQLSSVRFTNMSITTSVCEPEFWFNNSAECLNEQKIYCQGTEVFVEHQIIPPHIDIENACLKNMIVETTSSLNINSISLDNTQLPEDVSMITFNERASGKLRECPLQLPHGATCKDSMWINAYTSLNYKDVSGVDFNSIAFNEDLNWYNVYGIVEKCPISVPFGWDCVEFINKRTFMNGGMFLGAGVDYSQYDHLPDDIDATDIDFKNAKFDRIKRFYGFKGAMLNCPSQLPKGYTCHNIVKGSCRNMNRHVLDRNLFPVDYYTILGPYVDITDADLEFVCLTEETNLIGVHGKSSSCPSFYPGLKNKGYECMEETDNYILGPGVELAGVPFEILNSIAAIAPKVQLTHATINDKILINDVENDFNCGHIESILAETCRSKYTDDCSNNLPNYICETSNLHLGTCHGVCGNNLSSVYSEESTTNWLTIKTNSVPDHPYHIDREADNGHQVCEHNLVIQIPHQPHKSNEFQETCLGPIGILKSGALIYNHLETLQESFTTHHPTLDRCHGHADSNCFYHIHNMSMEIECSHDKPCEHIGYIRDGFPLYSQCPGLESCYVDQTYSPDNCNLDEANGFDFTDKGILNPSGEAISGYGYVVTKDYPYVPIKYAGSYVFDFINI